MRMAVGPGRPAAGARRRSARPASAPGRSRAAARSPTGSAPAARRERPSAAAVRCAPRRARSESRRPCRSANACRSMRGRRPACDTCRGCAPASRDAACRPAGTSQTARHRPASDVMIGSRSSRTSDVTTSRTGPAASLRVPTFSRSSPMSRAPQSFAGVGGSMVSARCTTRLMNWSGRVPNASSARLAVPNRFVASGKSAPFTFVNSKAGPLRGDDAAMNLRRLEHRIDRRRRSRPGRDRAGADR